MNLKKEWFENRKILHAFTDKFSAIIGNITCNPLTFIIACVSILLWCVFGDLYNYSAVWEKVMTAIVFLMIFIIQQAQSKDTLALQLKLNELIAATKGASNRVLNIEDMTTAELTLLKNFYLKLSELSEKDGHFGASHSIDEAKKNEAFKEA
ncbi:MAG: putative small integral rane protein [Flavipsychrobacter sp.]|jgi:low affinity Fe/Cu permease|nr:putative small integral rane protein [Flavipsychrobacter sp.]